jgi:hypothetical protein
MANETNLKVDAKNFDLVSGVRRLIEHKPVPKKAIEDKRKDRKKLKTVL